MFTASNHVACGPDEFLKSPKSRLPKYLRKFFQISFLLPYLAVIGILPLNFSSDSVRHLQLALFFQGLVGIAVDELIQLPKAPLTLLLSFTLWALNSRVLEEKEFRDSLDVEINHCAQVLFFLLPAMAVVETINSCSGFRIVVQSIRFLSRGSESLLPIVLGLITFFLSALVDNMTSTIIMLQVLKVLLPSEEGISSHSHLQQRLNRLILETRRDLGALVVVAANAGGAWSPIGDFTTTMLWLEDRISGLKIVLSCLIPSLANLLLVVLIFRRRILKNLLEGDRIKDEIEESSRAETFGKSREPITNSNPEIEIRNLDITSSKVKIRGVFVFSLGLTSLVLVPVLHGLLNIPPFMGIFLSLTVLWLAIDVVFNNFFEKNESVVVESLTRVDLQGFFFFAGILFSVGALNASGNLRVLAKFIQTRFPSTFSSCFFLGIASALVDNVPLVQAVIDMFDESQDSRLWHLLALCGGTGGSMLIIGSVAGVTFLNVEKEATFLWYVTSVAPVACLAYCAGVLVYYLQPWAP